MMIYSCSGKDQYHNAQIFQHEDFKESQSLMGNIVEFDDIVLNPTRIYLCDTVLITIENDGKTIFKLYGLNSKKKIGERIKVGQGPNEMIHPSFVDIDEKSISFYDTVLSTIFRYSKDEFVNEIDPKPTEKIKLNEKVFGETAVINRGFVCSDYNPSYLFIRFNEEGNKVNDIGKYPNSHIEYTDYEKIEAFRFSFVTNKKDNIFVCYNWTDLIEIYNIDGSLKKRFHGPEKFYAHFKEFHDGNYISASHEKGKNRDAYFNPVVVHDEIFVLFSGKYIDEEGYNILANSILVFDWNGEPKKKMSLNQGVFSFTVDHKNKKIYGISDTPEYHILEYAYN